MAISGQQIAQRQQPVHCLLSLFMPFSRNTTGKYPLALSWDDTSIKSFGQALIHSKHPLQSSWLTSMVPLRTATSLTPGSGFSVLQV